MKAWIFSLILGLALVGPARADETAIRGVISAQIEAFKADDFATAFTFASPTIQGIFGTSERFGLMVREGYPMVWRPGSVTFLDLETINGELWQTVLVSDGNGQDYLLGYHMIPGESGWKINAVRVKKAAAGLV